MKAVIFDLFGTLVSEVDVGYPSAEQVALKLALDPGGFCHEYDRLRPHRYVGETGDFGGVVVRIAKTLGADLSDQAVREVVDERRNAFERHLADVEPEIIAMLEEVQARGIRLALISNTDGSEVESWSRSRLAGFFELVLFSHEARCMKPDPAIYTSALSGLGLSATECLYIGDGGSDELRGAAAVGMRPCCAMWFLDRHRDLYGEDEIARRMGWFPVFREPQDVIGLLF